MKDGIKLHPEHGLNPSIEVCMICGEEMGIALLGNNINGQAPHHICVALKHAVFKFFVTPKNSELFMGSLYMNW